MNTGHIVELIVAAIIGMFLGILIFIILESYKK
jgi:hypothetical protein